MFTNNFKNLMNLDSTLTFKNVAGSDVSKDAVLPKGTSSPINGHYGYGHLAYNYNATTAANSYTDEQTTYTYHNIISNSAGTIPPGSIFIIFVGSGTTAATATDYKLATPLTLDVVSSACYHNANGKTLTSRTFQNTGSSAVTVSEVGLYLVAASKSSATPIIMIGRRVLSSPVTIAPGASKTFEYEIDFSGIQYGEA